MCGIIGLFLKDSSLSPNLGDMLTDMLITMTDRGPDSAGIAVYSEAVDGFGKMTLQAANPESALDGLAETLGRSVGVPVTLTRIDTHANIVFPKRKFAEIRSALKALPLDIRLMSTGESMEIYKEVGLPEDVAGRFKLREMRGSHGIGHTRMATESAVTTMGAHPFSTGADQCLVHNGSLSNHNSLRRKLGRQGIDVDTENDSEVAAAYLTHQMTQGKNLGEALEASLDDLDGFFTFVVGTKNGFGLLRDPIACKPAVMAETDQYVAFGSEYRALVSLPHVENAKVWEPEPASVYFWER